MVSLQGLRVCRDGSEAGECELAGSSSRVAEVVQTVCHTANLEASCSSCPVLLFHVVCMLTEPAALLLISPQHALFFLQPFERAQEYDVVNLTNTTQLCLHVCSTYCVLLALSPLVTADLNRNRSQHELCIQLGTLCYILLLS